MANDYDREEMKVSGICQGGLKKQKRWINAPGRLGKNL